MPTNDDTAARRPQARRVVMHHPKRRKEARFRPAEQDIWRRKGWVDGRLPAEQPEADQESTSGQDGGGADKPAAKTGRNTSGGNKAAEGK